MSVGADAIIGTDGIGITDFAFWNTAIYFGDGYSIAPSNIGIATIWDWDFLLWAVSQLNEAVNRGETPPATIR